MPLDLLNEDVLTLKTAAATLPGRCGRRGVHIGTLYRWIHRGIDGITLEAVKAGGIWVTTRQALDRFLHAVTENAVDNDLPRVENRRDQHAIERALHDAGL